MSKDETISVYDVAKELNLNHVTLIKRLDYADCKISNNRFSRDVFETVLRQREETVNLTTLIHDYYRDIKGVSIQEHFMNKLLVYTTGYNLWGARYIENPIFQCESYRDNSIFVYQEDVKIIQSHLREMVVLNGASYNEKFEFLLNETCLKEYGETIRLLRAFVGTIEEREAMKLVEVANYFRHVLKKELTEYDSTDISVLFQNTEKDLSGPGKNALVNFYSYMRENSSCCSNIVVRYNRHALESNESVPPYDLNTYFSLAYMTMNEEYWDEQIMLKKAVEKEKHAKVWLYHLMHFLCAWRSIDIRSKLPRFKLQDAPKEVLDKVANKGYSEQFYISVAEAIGYLFYYNGNRKDKKPEKTQKHEDTPLLRLVIPEGIKPIFGMLAVLCEAHNQINGQNGALCNMSALEMKDGIKLFGTQYSVVLKGKGFSNRRANNNYLNMTSEKSEQEGIDGYLLAAYARSHTGGLDRVPQVTSRYLKAKMDGYSVGEIVKCLIERGVCSFVPYLFCSVIDNEQFLKKHINEQTTDIKNLCTSPSEIENILTVDEKLAQISKDKVKEILRCCDNPSMVARRILESIINGDCYGKNEGVFCLSKACYKGCVQRQRTTCIGCGNEMYLKSVLIDLSLEIFKQEEFLRKAVTEGERIRRTMILKKRLYPVSHEILYTIKYVFHEDVSDYKEILERGGQYAFISNS